MRMMDANQRRLKITEYLQTSDKPITGNELAQLLGVTRQVIVQDIAILRAGGLPLVSTTSGYLLIRETTKQRFIKVLNCHHKTLEQAEQELKIIVQNGGKVRDVMVEHPIYGEITGNLMLSTPEMVDDWLERAKASHSLMLSAVTNGNHMHTVESHDEETMNVIESKLRKAGLLLELPQYGSLQEERVSR